MSRMRFIPVVEVAALEELFARSSAAPVILFLHDGGCPISARAYREMARLAGDIPLIDVRRGRVLSQEIEGRTGVRHESPQVIVLRHGRAVWSASHAGITATDVEDAVQGAA